MEWFSTLSLALGSAWTSGINLYATVTLLGLLQKFNFAADTNMLKIKEKYAKKIF
jgi:hypothetical protein